MASAKREHKTIMTDRFGDPIRLWWDHAVGVCELEISEGVSSSEGGSSASLMFNARELIELGNRLAAEGAAQLDDPAAPAAPSTGLSEEQVEEVVRRLLARSKEYVLASSGAYDWPDGASHGLSVAAGVAKGGEQ